MTVAITALYAALCGVMIIVLGWFVVRGRRAQRVGLGSGGEVALERAIRAHGNFTEYVPLALLLLLVAELGQIPSAWLHANGVALVVARALHGWGLSHHGGVSFGRFWGTALTWLVILSLAVTDLAVFARSF